MKKAANFLACEQAQLGVEKIDAGTQPRADEKNRTRKKKLVTFPRLFTSLPWQFR